MRCIFNVDFELSSMIFMVMLVLYISIQYDLRIRRNREFFVLAIINLLANFLDVLTAFTISMGSDIPDGVNLFLNTLYFISLGLFGFQFMRYSMTLAKTTRMARRMERIANVAFVIFCTLLIVNVPTGIIASFENGLYIHGPIYYSIYFYPYSLLLYCFIRTILRAEELEDIRKKILMASYLTFCLGVSLLQMLYLRTVLLTIFSISMGMLFMLVLLETPDYQQMIWSMEQLKMTRGEAEKSAALAQSASNAKSSFLSHMSHELRTPLNAVLGYAGLILENTREKDTAENAVKIRAAGQDLLSITNNVKDFVELEDGTATVNESVYQTQSMIRDMLTSLEFFNADKKLKVLIHVDPEFPENLYGDHVRILQIMNNLTSNAVKYTDHGQITITLRWNGDGFLFSVEDTGIGMRRDDMRRISESFLRMDEKHTGSVLGMGLGLSLVTRLLLMMDSRLEYDSTYGVGSRFWFHLKQERVGTETIGEMAARNLENTNREEYIGKNLSAPIDETVSAYSDMVASGFSSREEGNNHESSLLAPGQKGTILAVDDNRLNLDLFRRLLSGTGYRIVKAENGKEALNLIRNSAQPFSIIFMDHMMPVMDGVEAMHIIRDENLCPHTPVVALTANAVTDVQREYIHQGFSAYLLKPVVRQELIDTIERLTGRSVSERSANVAEVGQEEGLTSAMPGSLNQNAKSMEVLGSFLNTEAALTYCADSIDFYLVILNDYVEGNRREEIEENYGSEDWDNYRIGVHALKSSSRTIGADQLSEDAKALEDACKEERTDYIREHHREVMEEYTDILVKISEALKQDGDADQHTEEILPESLEKDLDTEDRPVQPLVEAPLSTELERPLRWKVMVVDDDDLGRDIAKQMLSGRYDVMTASSADMAMDLLEEERPNLILLDIHMPEKDGFEFLRELHEEKQITDLPVIFLTGDEDREAELQGLKSGAMDFIHKPYVENIMIQRVDRILELNFLQHRLQMEVARQTRVAEKRKAKFELLSIQTMKALSGAVDAKDHYTHGHSGRVAQYSQEIARRAGKSEEVQKEAYYTGLLHDIGKIGVPDDVINDKGMLTDEQYMKIRMHPVIGSRILQNITEIPNIAVGAHWHHERYNGTGYPDGLIGSEIPEIARIIGVADAYDAMTSKRSYRDVMEQAAVRREIASGCGTQFDPYYGRIMLEMIDEDKDYTMRES